MFEKKEKPVMTPDGYFYFKFWRAFFITVFLCVAMLFLYMSYNKYVVLEMGKLGYSYEPVTMPGQSHATWRWIYNPTVNDEIAESNSN